MKSNGLKLMLIKCFKIIGFMLVQAFLILGLLGNSCRKKTSPEISIKSNDNITRKLKISANVMPPWNIDERILGLDDLLESPVKRVVTIDFGPGLKPNNPSATENFPWNPSIIDYKDGYLLSFRYDHARSYQDASRQTWIAVVELDQNFEIQGEIFTLNTGTKSAEDPRLLRVGDEIVVVFNDFPPVSDYPRGLLRTMHAGYLRKKEDERWAVEQIRDFDLTTRRTEKNWVPFAVGANGQNEKLNFSYSIEPHLVYEAANWDEGRLRRLGSSTSNIEWSFGALRGGTPAIKTKVGEVANYGSTRDELNYIGFFHSSKKCPRGNTYYVFGAYTFGLEPPFALNKISPGPIYFPGMYSSKVSPASRSDFKVIFPGGLIEKEIDGSMVYIVAAGINDSAVKILIIDKKKVLDSLVAVDRPALVDERRTEEMQNSSGLFRTQEGPSNQNNTISEPFSPTTGSPNGNQSEARSEIDASVNFLSTPGQ